MVKRNISHYVHDMRNKIIMASDYKSDGWGDGDSLDRERVRDILLDEYNLEIKVIIKKGLCIELTQGQYDHLYNIMCSQDEIIDYLNESDDFDPQTFDNLFDAICNARRLIYHDTWKHHLLNQRTF